MTEENKVDADRRRIIAMHLEDCKKEEIEQIASSNMKLCDGEVVVFASSVEQIDVEDAKIVAFPAEADTAPKKMNFILGWCKGLGFDGFLHIVDSSIRFNGKTKAYMDKLESTMKVLDYGIHFSTATDRCNFIFNKFCPRMTLDIDDEEAKAKLGLPDKIFFTSNSNISYMVFDFSTPECLLRFDERFTIGMYYIIDFLSRRRAQRAEGQLYFMNQYIAISDEIGGYDIAKCDRNDITDNQVMAKENELFKTLKVDYASDNNLDIVLDMFYNKLKSKLA